MLQRLFRLSEHQTNVKTEVLAGITTFLTMSYIIFVNPDILSSTGMDRGAVFVATCLAAVVGTLTMAFVANWPIGMAPGDRKSTRLNSSHVAISYAVFCLKKKTI